MSAHDHSNHPEGGRGSLLTSRVGLALVAFIAVAGFLLFSEHQAHVLGALVWLLPLVCVVLHLFMHGGHGHGGHGGRDRTERG